MARLCDVADLNMGQSPPSSTYNDAGVGLPFFQGKVDFGFRYPTPRVYCSVPQKIADPGDILISIRAPVGPLNICDRTSCIGRGLGAVRAKSVDAEYLYFDLMHSERQIAALGTGSTFQSINRTQLGAVIVNPNGFEVDEQRRIAAVLSAVQQAVERQERLIALTAELKKALMHKLFTEGTRGEPQKQTEIGPAPESWEIVQIGSLARIGNGSTPKRDNLAYWKDGSIPWLTSGKIHEGRITKPDQHVTKVARAECHLPMVAAGSLLVAITGEGKTLGNAALVEFDTCISQHLAYMQFHRSDVLPEFLLYFLQRQYAHLRQMSVGAGSTKKALTCGLLKRYAVPVPAMDEQKRIAAALDAIVVKTNGHEQTAECLRGLFRTLLHQLMTAQVRVHDLDVSALEEAAQPAGTV